MICAVSGCCDLARERVTVWPEHLAGGPETRDLCALHAEEVRSWASAEGLDRPRARWIKAPAPTPTPAPPNLLLVSSAPACAVCGVVKALHRRGICQACIRRAMRAEKRERLAG